MASILKEGKFDLNLFDTELGADKQSFGVSYGRTNPRPLDGTSIFRSKSAAEDYALTSTVAYPGQYIAVVTSAGVDAYVITQDNKIRLLATGGSADEIAANLNTEIANRTAADSVISAALSTFIETTFPAAQTAQETALKSELSIGFSVDNTTTDSLLKTYKITQGGVEHKIEIPKDFLVKDASVKTAEDDSLSGEGIVTGDKYIDFVINSKDDTTGEGTHLYIPVKSLVDEYTGEATGTISVTVDNATNKISAAIVEKSITAAHLSEALSTEIAGINTKADNALTAISTEEGRATQAEEALGQRIDALTADNTGILAQAKEYTNGVSVALSTDYVAKIADAKGIAIQHTNDISTALSTDYVAKIATAKDEAVNAANGYTNGQLDSLTATYDGAGKFVNKITQNRGIVSAEFKQLEISDISGLQQTLNQADAKFDNYVLTSVVNNPTAEDKLQKRSDVEAKIATLTADIVNNAPGKTISKITQANGVVTAEFTDISIAQDKVIGLSDNLTSITADISTRATKTELTSEAKTLSDLIATEATTRENAITSLTDRLDKIGSELAGDYAKLSDSIQISTDLDALEAKVYNIISTDLDALEVTVNTVSSDYLKASDFSTISTTIGLDRASVDNKVVTSADLTAAVADLAGAMHFVGVKNAVPPNDGEEYKSGDIILVGTKEYVFNGENWIELGDEALYATAAALTAETEARISADNFLSGKIDEISANYATTASVSGIKSELEDKITAEETARKDADEVLSTAIDNKIFAGKNGELSAVDSLSVVKISQADYHELVKDENVDNNVVYIVNNDGTYNMYGETISELSTTGIEGTSEAANTLYVDKKVQEVKDSAISAITLNGQTFTIANNIASLTIESLNGGNAEG